MNAEIKAEIHNRFYIEVIDATGKIKERAQAHNVVCTALWNHLLSDARATYFNYILYGSGSGTPSASDTGLFHFDGYAFFGDVTFNYDSGKRTMAFTRSAVLGISEAVGVTITEVGIGFSQASNSLVTHAMLEDMNGNPISIEKTDTDIINIYATVYVHASDLYGGIVADISYALANNSYFNGLAPWLAGIGNNDWTTAGTGQHIPLNEACLSRDYPATTAISGDPFPHTSVSLNAENRTITSNIRFGVSDFNIEGGAKYLSLYSMARVGLGAGYMAQPSVIIPVGGVSGFMGHQITADSIGTGDGSRTAFQTHFDVARDFVLKVNGTAVSNFTRDGRDITFSVAPEIGAVVTADYFTDTIPKDADHVYDLTVTISFGEYVQE